MNKAITVCCFLLFACFSCIRAQISSFIHLDQFGYLPEANKFAVLSDPQVGFNANDSYSPSAQIELRDALTDSVIMSLQPIPWNAGATHDQSGDKGWWVDFSDLEARGTYYLIDVLQDERSAEFEIRPSVYEAVLMAAARMFYYNRCNFPKQAPYAESGWTDAISFTHALQDAQCRFIDDPANASLEKELAGGWFDAGDYNKYVTFAQSAVHNLLWAYTENPDVFVDSWNIPESDNDIPDILDEVKWELDWLYKMTNPDGTVHIKMGSNSHSSNALAPPSVNTDQRYYGPVCTSASIAAAGMLAHGAEVLGAFPAWTTDAQLWKDRAIACWNYVQPLLENEQLETGCDDGSIVAGDADWTAELQKENALTSAIHLFSLTGDSSYHHYLLSHALDAEPLNGGNFWGPYKIPLYDALLHYSQLQEADPVLQNDITGSLATAAANNWNGFYGFNEDDLYRAYMPDWSYHWGSNQAKAAYGILNLLLSEYGINAGSSSDYQQKAEELLHYFHGINPLGLVQLSNMYELGGDRCVNEIYHTWFADGSDWDHSLTSSYGPAPGYVTGGANADFSVSSLSPPSGQPRQKSYLDFNTSWPDNSWEISEPAIYYQAMYIRLLAHFVQSDSSMSTGLMEGTAEGQKLWVYPNPANEQITISGAFVESQIDIWSLSQKIRSLTGQSKQTIVDLADLPPGVYFVRVASSNEQEIYWHKFLKR
ncbi:MAG: glycoside hydrolase family 9 protein [Bacteroidota bacterium]